jgi:hypothetical protein
VANTDRPAVGKDSGRNREIQVMQQDCDNASKKKRELLDKAAIHSKNSLDSTDTKLISEAARAHFFATCTNEFA